MIVTAKDTDDAQQNLCRTLQLAGIVKVLPWGSTLVARLPVAKASRKFRAIATDLFAKRYEQGGQNEGPDVFFHLLGEGQESATKLTRSELAADSALVVAAGADTTRLVLTYLFMRMMREPQRYKMLQDALDEAIGEDEYPTHEVLARIPLLEAYINETLRLNSPVPFANQREVPAEGATLVNRYIPGGTQVRLASYTIHRDPKYFDEPDAFMPERWLPSSDFAKKSYADKAAFFPFLFGAYHCVGRNFAFQEMRLLTATLMRRYDMELEPGFDTYAFEAAIEDRGLIEIHKPLSVILTRRTAKGH